MKLLRNEGFFIFSVLLLAIFIFVFEVNNQLHVEENNTNVDDTNMPIVSVGSVGSNSSGNITPPSEEEITNISYNNTSIPKPNFANGGIPIGG